MILNNITYKSLDASFNDFILTTVHSTRINKLYNCTISESNNNDLNSLFTDILKDINK